MLWVILGLDQLLLLLIGSVRLERYEMSEFQLRAQFAQQSDTYSKLRRSLHKQFTAVQRLQQLELIIAATVAVALLTYLQSPILGVLSSLASFTVLVMLSRLKLVQNVADKQFEKSLEVILQVATGLKPLWQLIGLPTRRVVSAPASKLEFIDQLRRFPSTVLSPDERQRLELMLSAGEKTVKDIMTPKKRVVTVEPSATLGPVVLSDLQKTGHGYFPVATKKGQPEGLLTLSDVGEIHQAKQRSVVRDLMSTQLSWVGEEASLYQLAQIFLKDKQYLLLVKDTDEQFSGVVTVADLMKHLVGVVSE